MSDKPGNYEAQKLASEAWTDPTTDAAKLLPCPPWRSMKTAPLDETPVLLHTACHGIVEAWYSPGHWEDYHEGREYYGAQWVCADDAFQIEVEEIPEEEGGLHHGTATAWMPLVPANTRPQPAPPAGEPDWQAIVNELDQVFRQHHTDADVMAILKKRLSLAARPKVENTEIVAHIALLRMLGCVGGPLDHAAVRKAADLLERLAQQQRRECDLWVLQYKRAEAAEAKLSVLTAADVTRVKDISRLTIERDEARENMAEREAELAQMQRERDGEREAREKASDALRAKDEAMGVLIKIAGPEACQRAMDTLDERHAARQQQKASAEPTEREGE